MQMGCYGIGVTRLIGAAVEVLSTDTHIRWPFPLAPFSVCIIPPEKRSKAFSLATHHLDEVHQRLNTIPQLDDSILVDDRIRITIGERFRDAKRYGFSYLFIYSFVFFMEKSAQAKKQPVDFFSRLGIPLVVVIGKKASDPENPQFELHFIQEEKECHLPLNNLIAEVTKYSQAKFKEH